MFARGVLAVVCVCIDMWWASCVGDAMCYIITICIRFSSSHLVRREACDEGVSNIRASLVSLLVMADACCYYTDSRGFIGFCRKVVVSEVWMKGRRGRKQRGVCEACLKWLLVDKLADAIEPPRHTHASEQTTPLPCNDATIRLGGHPSSLISAAYHLFCARMLVFDSEAAGTHTNMQQHAQALMIRLCRKAMLPSGDITSRIGFWLFEGGACGVCHYSENPSMGSCKQKAVGEIHMQAEHAKKKQRIVGHPSSLISAAYHLFCARMLVFDSEAAGTHTNMQQHAQALMIRLCRKAMLPSGDITSRIGFWLFEGSACDVCHYSDNPNMGSCEQKAVGEIYMRGRCAKKKERLVCGPCRDWLVEESLASIATVGI